MRVIVDADILSMFAKVGALELLEGLFGAKEMAMTPGICHEISTPLEYGYAFPLRVLARISIASLDEETLAGYKQLRIKDPRLGRGELEAIALCKVKGFAFATNDLVARRACQEERIKVFSLQERIRPTRPLPLLPLPIVGEGRGEGTTACSNP